MTNLTLSINDNLIQKLHDQANLQGISVEQCINNLLQKQLLEQQSIQTCKPKRIGRYGSGRNDISIQTKTLARQAMRKKHDRHS